MDLENDQMSDRDESSPSLYFDDFKNSLLSDKCFCGATPLQHREARTWRVSSNAVHQTGKKLKGAKTQRFDETVRELEEDRAGGMMVKQRREKDGVRKR
ncbi:lebercilin [Tachysurus ichikawai]